MLGEMPAIDDLRALLEKQLDTIEESEPGVRDGLDPEELHRFRVATRRSRALIRASRPLVRDQLAALDRELRWLGGSTGPVRDLDVLIEHLRDLIDELEPDQAGGEAIVAALERERLKRRETLVKAIDGERFRALLGRFEAALPVLEAVDDEVSLSRLAERELKRLRSAYGELGDNPADEDLHGVRIRAKHARYAAELASREAPALSGLVSATRELQDLIGSHQDAVVAEQRVRALATDDSRLAAGRIVERERRRRETARAELPAAWRRVEREATKGFEAE
jgi:CHAD domain-containing protein